MAGCAIFGRKGKDMVVLLILIIIALAIIVRNIRIVPQAHCFVIERLGKFRKVWDAGIHVKVPLIDRIAAKISEKEQVLDFPPQTVITKDNVTMQIDSVVYAKVFDAKKYTYGVENPTVGLMNLAATTLRSVIGEMELDATLSSRQEINDKMQFILDQATDEWGIKVIRVEIKNITPPAEIEEAMTKQMRAERERRQTVLEAEAHKESVVSRAEGDRQAKILSAEAERDAQIALAEGRARAVQLVYEAEAEGLKKLSEANITEAVLRIKGMEALKDVADGQATKIYIPNDLSGAIGNLAVAGDAMGIAPLDAAAVPRKEYRKEQVFAAASQKVEADPCIEDETSPGTIGAAQTNAVQQQRMSKITGTDSMTRKEG